MNTRGSQGDPIGDLSDVGVTVTTLLGQVVNGRLVELTSGGAEVRFSADDAHRLHVGHLAKLKLEGSLVVSAVETAVKVHYLCDDVEDGHILCGFQLLESSRFERSLSERIRVRLNRRKMFRVRPCEGDPVWVRLKGAVPGGIVEKARGDLADISGIGLGVLLESQSAGPFEEIDLVELSFKLPSWEAELRFVGRVRYRLRLAERFRLGIEFDPSRSESFDRQQGLILQYIHDRRRALDNGGTVDEV